MEANPNPTPPQQEGVDSVVVIRRERAVADRLAMLGGHPYGTEREEYVTITTLLYKFGENVVSAIEHEGRYNIGRIIALIDSLQGIKYIMLDMVNPWLKAPAKSSPLADPFIEDMTEMIKECNFFPKKDIMPLVCLAAAKLAKDLTRLAGTLSGYNRDRLISLLYNVQEAKGFVADALNASLIPPMTKAPGS